VATPREARFDKVFQFTKKRKRKSDAEDDDEEIELEKESLMAQAGNIWDIIEFAFYKGQGGWIDLLSLIVRILRNDFDTVKWGIRTIVKRVEVDGRWCGED
jgi:hypothetical protein